MKERVSSNKKHLDKITNIPNVRKHMFILIIKYTYDLKKNVHDLYVYEIMQSSLLISVMMVSMPILKQHKTSTKYSKLTCLMS